MNDSAQDPDVLLRKIADEGIKYIDLRFTDPGGRWEHLTVTSDYLDEDAIEDGVMFDGSSIAGWKEINESDMALMPDASFSFQDPFYAEPTLAVVCNISEPGTGAPYGRDPRSTARKAVAYLQQTGIGDNAFFGPEAEFFVFDDVRFDVQQNRVSYEIDSEEAPHNSGTRFRDGQHGASARTQGRVLSRESGRQLPGSSLRDAVHPHIHRRACRKASPRSRASPARTRSHI